MPNRRQFIAAAAGLMMVACAAPGSPQGEGPFNISAVTEPDPPRLGQNKLVVTVLDKSNTPVTGARVQLSADMVGHSMGEQKGVAQEEGAGKYSLRAGFGMAGGWFVVVNVEKAGVGSGSKRIEFNVK